MTTWNLAYRTVRPVSEELHVGLNEPTFKNIGSLYNHPKKVANLKNVGGTSMTLASSFNY